MDVVEKNRPPELAPTLPPRGAGGGGAWARDVAL
jgi:hypothetical protein